MLNVIELQQPGFDRRHDTQQPALALDQRQADEIFASDAQYIERIEVWPLAPKEQLVEVRAAIRLQTANLPVEHGGPDRVRDLLREPRLLLECVAITGDELAAMAAHMRERAEPVHLRLEDPIGMIERLGDPEEPPGGDSLRDRDNRSQRATYREPRRTAR